MQIIDKAKELLVGDIKCVVLCGDRIYKSDKKGIAPLLGLVDDGGYCGCVAADKIVGKAAAFIYAKIGAKEIYAEVLSKAAIPVLERYSVKYSYGTLTDRIRNRQGNGICPMEQTVENIDDIDWAVCALREKVEMLKRGE